MAFAPPRPQSIFGRSAPPQAQIDWRLGAQVGKNIGGGIQSAMASLSKGFVELQEGKRKKAEEEEMGALLKKFAPDLGMTDTDIKAAGKNPNIVLAFQQLKMQKEQIDANAEIARATAARQAASDKMAKEKHLMDVYDDMLERAPGLASMDASGKLTVDQAALGQLSPDQQAAYRRIPIETIMNMEKDENAFPGMMKKVKGGIKGFKNLTDREVKAWAGLDLNTQNRLISERPTQVIIGGTQAATDYATASKSSPLPAGRGIILDAQGNYKGQFDARTDSGRYKQFEQALRDAKKDQGYQLTEQEVQAYFLNEKGIDADELSWLIMQHVDDPVEAARLVRLFIETGGRGGVPTPAPGGGGTPPPGGGPTVVPAPTIR